METQHYVSKKKSGWSKEKRQAYRIIKVLQFHMNINKLHYVIISVHISFVIDITIYVM